ncbi:MAG TPA: LysR family transcriptional regulator, partial [Cystobacter sp.]
MNLLAILDAVLRERSVQRAAERLAMTPSAVSHALARLRDIVGDPLLVRTPKGMVPTARAERLAPRLRNVLGALEGIFDDEAGFDPSAARQVFKISSADLAQFVILPPLLKQLAREAPGLRLVLRPPRPEVLDALASGSLDLAFGIFDEAPEGFRYQAIFREEFLCMLRRGHPAASAPLELDSWLALQHVSVAPRGGSGSIVDDALAKLGKQRDIALVVPHFLMAPLIIAETDLSLLLPARLARRYATMLPVELL